MGGGPEIVPPPVRAGNQRPPGWLLQVATALPVLLQAAVLSRTNETQMARKSRLVLFVAALALASVPLALGAAATATASISGLQLNYLPSPALGVDKMRARFSWVLPAQRDQPAQATCRVIVSTGNNTVAFDSGVVRTQQPEITVPPMGLASDTDYSWTVTISFAPAFSELPPGRASRCASMQWPDLTPPASLPRAHSVEVSRARY